MARNRDKLVREALRERFVVTMKGGSGSFDGLLDEVDDRTICLRDAVVISGSRTPVDGKLLLNRADIAYMQRP